MRNKTFKNAVITGAGAVLGCHLMKKAISTVQNPYTRAKIKSGFKTIKDAFTKKTES